MRRSVIRIARYEVRARVIARPKTLTALLRRSALRHGESIFLSQVGGKRWSYAEVEGAVARLAVELRKKRIARGSRIALIGENGPSWVVGLFAALEVGATVLVLDPAWEPRLRDEFLTSCKARVVLLAGEGGRCSVAAPVIEVKPPETGAVRPLPRKDPRAPQDEALIFVTPGTSGKPKMVIVNDGVLLLRSRALTNAWSSPESPCLASLAWLPFFTVVGLTGSLLMPMRSGARVGLLAENTPEASIAALACERPTHLIGTPPFFSGLRERLAERRSIRLPAAFRRRLAPLILRALGGRLQTCVSHGMPLLDEEVDFWRSVGISLLDAYGSTESAGIVTCTRAEDARPTGVGVPLQGAEIEIRNPNEEGIGEIVIRAEGGIETGDLGRIDAAGRLHLHGRLSHALRLRGGGVVDPERVEAYLSRGKYVTEVAIVKEGSPDDERPVALVVPDREALNRERILDGIGITNFGIRGRAAHLPPAARPVRMVIVRGPLPRNRAGKVQRHLLTTLWQARESDAARGTRKVDGSALGNDRAALSVGDVLSKRAVGGRNLSLEDEIGIDLGCDSLERLAIVSALESQLGRSLPESALLAPTVADLIAAVRAEEPSPDQTGLAPDDAARELLGRARRTAWRGRWIRNLVMSRSRRHFEKNLAFTIEGVEHLPSEETMILCPNHLSDLDGLLLCAMLPRALMQRTWVLGKAQVFRHPLARRMLFIGHVLPADNRRRFFPALRTARLLLEQKECLLIFPEGQRALDRRLGIWRGGAGLLAALTGAPLLPIALAGVERVLPPGSIRPRCRDSKNAAKSVHLRMAPPIRAKAAESGEDLQETIERARALTQEVQAAVQAELRSIPEDLRVRF